MLVDEFYCNFVAKIHTLINWVLCPEFPNFLGKVDEVRFKEFLFVTEKVF
jgi:hypothetical protein